ncbi:MAG TPA: flagellar biosynthetic protein FliO [Terracidiphilus sp.]|jgi:flagellar biogenesis protein FliO
MKQNENAGTARVGAPAGGLAGWLLGRLRIAPRPRPRLALLERIALAPRQSLALVEAEGRRFLVATSPEGAPAFYPLDEPSRPASPGRSTTPLRPSAAPVARVSW